MMKGMSSVKLRFSLLALAIALTGCPNPGPGTSADPDPSPSASQSPGGDQPALEINTLGLIKAELQASTFTLGKARFVITLSDLGFLLEMSATTPTFSDKLVKVLEGGGAGQYVVDFWSSSVSPEDYTHVFRRAEPADHWQELGVTLGGQADVTRSLDANLMTVSFPANAKGDLVVAAPDGSSLRAVVPHRNADTPPGPPAYWTFDERVTIPESQQNWVAFHDATASLTVAVNELDGQPSTGLTAANFAIATPLDEFNFQSIKGKVQSVAETSPGKYQVVSTFEGLRGKGAMTRTLILHVGNPRVQQEVTP
jgi:hypothetical protein